MLCVRGQTLIVVAAHGARVAACPVLMDPEMGHRSDLPLDWTQTLRLGLKGHGVIRCVPRVLALDGRSGSSACRESSGSVGRVSPRLVTRRAAGQKADGPNRDPGSGFSLFGAASLAGSFSGSCFSGRRVTGMRRVGRVADDLAERVASMVSREMRLQARENA